MDDRPSKARGSKLLPLVLPLALGLLSVLASPVAADTVTFTGTTSPELLWTATLTLDLTAKTIALTATVPPVTLPATPATHWVRTGQHPDRIVFTLTQPSLRLEGNVLLAPDNRGVLSVVANHARATYLLRTGPAPTPGGFFLVDGPPYEDVASQVDVRFTGFTFSRRDGRLDPPRVSLRVEPLGQRRSPLVGSSEEREPRDIPGPVRHRRVTSEGTQARISPLPSPD